jgi:hypothetical protein
VKETVFKSDETATAAVTAIYHQMQSIGFANGDAGSVTALAGLSADELVTYPVGDAVFFYQNDLIPANVTNLALWSTAYNSIYLANAVLEGVGGSTAVTEPMRAQLEGESKFIRAFCYFYLVNLYGDVPLILETDYRLNAGAARTPKDEVYAQMMADLADAKALLPGDYSVSKGERTRANRQAASALLARVYLYRGEWAKAEAEATTVIESGMYDMPALDDVFLANSAEAIWQLLPVDPTFVTWEGYLFVLQDEPTSPFSQSRMALSSQAMAAFEQDDQREVHWTGVFEGTDTYYYPFKYKLKYAIDDATEYSMVLRLAEQYLIRAEARAQQSNIGGAQEDLNAVRSRANLADTDAASREALLTAIAHERQVELMAEWGHRWLDLKRTGAANAVLGPIKPLWKSTSVLYPIPQQERSSDPQLSQNDGYGAQ